MNNAIPDDLYYTKNHEWARIEGDFVVVGITEYAVEQMNRELVGLDLPEKGITIKQDDSFGVIDSVKAAFDIYAPVSGEIIEVNDDLTSAPEKIADSPYETGWLIKIKPSQLQHDLENLLSAEHYKKFVEEEHEG